MQALQGINSFCIADVSKPDIKHLPSAIRSVPDPAEQVDLNVPSAYPYGPDLVNEFR